MIELGYYNNRAPIELRIMKILKALERRPHYLNNLKRIRVLLIDELGQITGQQMHIMDRIFQKIHDSPSFFGGIHVITTLDHLQLIISESDSIYRYRPLQFYFKPYLLQHYIRATCPRQRDLLQRFRIHPKNPLVIENIINIISSHCNFASYADLSIEDPCLTTKKKGREIIARARTDAIARARGANCHRTKAIDSIMSRGGAPIRQILDKKVNEKISQQSSLPDDSQFFFNQTVHASMIIKLTDNITIPRSSPGIVQNVRLTPNREIDSILTDFGDLGIHNVCLIVNINVISRSSVPARL